MASAVAASQNGRAARRVSNYGIVGAGFGSAGVGLLGIGLAPSAIAVAVAALVVAAGWGLVLPSVDDALSERVPARFRAGALSLRNSTTFLGRATGPVLFAGLAATSGYRILLLGAGVAALACGALAIALAR